MTADPMTTKALNVIVDIAKERCEQTGHECDWECALLERSIVTVREALPAATGTARLAAQEPASGPETPQGHPSEGTGVSGLHARSESGDRRWSLTINDDGTITAAFDANSHTAVPTRERDIADAARPAHYRDAAASLRALGHDTAADLLDSTARDLTEGDTDG